MTANLSVDSSDTYAVIDKKNSRKHTKHETNPTPLEEYSVLKRTNLSSRKIGEAKVDYVKSSKDNMPSVYSVITRENISESTCSEHEQQNKVVVAQNTYWKYCIILAIPIVVTIVSFLILLATIISLNSSISNLNTKVAVIEKIISNNSICSVTDENDKVRIELNMQNLTITSLMSLLNSQMEQLKIHEKQFQIIFSSVNFSDFDLPTTIPLSNISQRIIYYVALLPSSCREILSGPSGYYLIRLSNGSFVTVFCEMMTCNGTSGGWMRVATLPKHSNGTAQCFPNFTHYEGSNRTQCVRNDTAAGCTSVIFPVFGVEYSHVCGEVRAYGENTPDGFREMGKTIDETYVDGISLTYNNTTRQHLWTYASETHIMGDKESKDCNDQSRQDFVQQYFSCMNLIKEYNCSFCSTNFSRTLQTPTTGNIELRVCRDMGSDDEDIILDTIEIYVH